MDNDAHELAEVMMRRLEQQDRIIDVLVDEIEDLKAGAVIRGQALAEVREILRTLGDSCQAWAAAVDRLTADS